MKIDKRIAEDKFDEFLMKMDDQLEGLGKEADEAGITLDFSLADLERLETLFDKLSKDADKELQSSLIVSFARHLGEVVRLNFGGKWTLPLEDEKNVNFNTPVITGHVPMDGLEFAPIFVMRGYALRRKKGGLKQAVYAQVEPKPLDVSHLVED